MTKASTIALLVLALVVVFACTKSPSYSPTPNIDATIQVAVAASIPTPAPPPTPDVNATVAAGVEATASASGLVIPTNAPPAAPNDTATPAPTLTPTRQPTPLPTNTPIATVTFTPVPTSTPTPTESLADVVERVRAGVVRIEGVDGSGSGFIVDSAGYILTNEHVISGNTRLTVVLDNGTRLKSEVIGSDTARDIALLKVEPSHTLTVLPFAASVREGEEVVALGHPLDLGASMTVTKGIVSALRTVGGVSYVQTDAAINPGNSGGPLINLDGEVVGMNTAGRDDADGIGFAIRSNVLSSRLTVMKSVSVSTPTPGPAVLVATPTHTPKFAFGPKDGEIGLDPLDGFIDEYETFVSFTDGIIEAQFINPYSPQEGDWSNGFMFRHKNMGTHFVFHIVTIHSDGNWYHHLRSSDNVDDDQLLESQYSNKIILAPDDANHLRVIASGSQGWLFINGDFVATLDLSGLETAGKVSAVGSWFQNDGVAGKSTRFRDFTIRELASAYGPRDGSIQHDPDDGFIDTYETYIRSLTDGIIEATFVNPYSTDLGDWSSGFMFRSGVFDEFHLLAVHNSGNWYHNLRTGDVETEQELKFEFSHLIRLSENDRNHLRVIFIENDGWLFINDVFAGKIVLTGLTRGGSVSAVAGYFTDDGISGESTPFEDFTVWSAD